MRDSDSPRKGERTRQRILARAAEVFNRRGYEGASLSELIEATEIQKGGLYRHFESKQQLALEAFRFAFAQARQARFVEESPEQTRLELLKAFLQRWIHPEGPLPAGGCPLFNAAIEADDGDPQLLEAVRSGLQGWIERLAGWIRQGIDRGEFRASVDAEASAAFIIGALEGALTIGRVQGTRRPLVQAAGFLESWLESELVGRTQARLISGPESR